MLPGMGSHVIGLRDLALSIGNERPVHGLQPTGHNLELLPYPSLEELASELIKDMRRVAKSGPYNLLGFSAGGLHCLRNRPAIEEFRRGRWACSVCSTPMAPVILGPCSTDV